MSTNIKCQYCNRYFLNNSAYSQHVDKCVPLYDISTEESNNEVSSDANDMSMSLDSNDFNHVEELQNVLASGSEMRENLSATQDMFEEYYADVSLISQSSSIIPEDSELREELESLEESFQNIEEPEINEFPNEAYADLMTLVTKHNLNNKAGNAIIKFFNNHSNVPVSPLPKNITAGRKYMDKMNLSQFSYHKHCILVHNGLEYFIHFRPIIKCIENLLSNLEITKHFVCEYKNLEVNIYKIFLY
jgi:hypothetical protein